MKLILASASPRRLELMRMLRVKDMEVIPALGEEADCAGLPPDAAVSELSLAKAREVFSLHGSGAAVIAADTIVYQDGEILGKPKDEADAERMLRKLSGRRHEVYTGVSVISSGTELTRTDMTAVYFRTITPREIAAYVATGEPMDKAGAYGAQGLGGLFIERLEGDFFSVMGLPICLLSQMLGKIGVNLI